MSDTHKSKIREAHIKSGLHKGIKQSPEAVEKRVSQFRGEKHWQWKGGKETEKKRRSFYEKRRKARKIGNGGSHTLSEWETLKAQYNWTCPCCKRKEPEIILTEDHIIPLAKGGSDNIENIQPLCGRCNNIKRTKIIKYY